MTNAKICFIFRSPVHTPVVTDQKLDSSEEKSSIEPKSKHTKIVVTSPDSDETLVSELYYFIV